MGPRPVTGAARAHLRGQRGSGTCFPALWTFQKVTQWPAARTRMLDENSVASTLKREDGSGVLDSRGAWRAGPMGDRGQAEPGRDLLVALCSPRLLTPRGTAGTQFPGSCPVASHTASCVCQINASPVPPKGDSSGPLPAHPVMGTPRVLAGPSGSKAPGRGLFSGSVAK